METNEIMNISKNLGIEGDVIGVSVLSSGHINSTFKIDVENSGKRKSYIIQKINTNVFKDPKNLMSNILRVTNFISEKRKNNKKVMSLKFLPGENGSGLTVNGGDYFRGYEFVDDSETYDITENQDIIYETDYAFGEFQKMLGDFPANELSETIPNFHNTPSRFNDLQFAVLNDAASRRDSVSDLISDYLSLAEPASVMYNKYLNGELPSRVTHNDTKCNNVLFDQNTKKHICVIDLDTVMPGLAGFDFGDGIRFIASTATEDEKDLNKVSLDLRKFESFAKGFLDGAGDVFTEEELKTLPLGAITMTVECGSRFLADYLNGDTYFKINYPSHNLDRAKCQLKLAQDMILNAEKMNEIIERCSNKNLKKNQNSWSNFI